MVLWHWLMVIFISFSKYFSYIFCIIILFLLIYDKIID